MVLYPALLFINGLSEYLLNRMMAAMGVLNQKNRGYHAVFAVLRIACLIMCKSYYGD